MFEPGEFEKARKRLDEGLRILTQREGASKRIGEETYAEVLMELMRLVLIQNETISLTAITEPEEFVDLHLLDSLSCVGLPELDSAVKIVDIGCGPGFPGLPLAALYPDKQFLLVDSLLKRIEFSEFAVSGLGLHNVDCLHTRAEKIGHEPSIREHFDLALSRAVGKLPVILEYCMPLVSVGGAGCFYKTIDAKIEIEESRLALKLLGGSTNVKTLEYTDLLPGRRHALYIVKKERKTPERYPRREGIPSKVPL